MKTEIYECDRCHKKAITSEDIEALDLAKAEFYVTGHAYNRELWVREWCAACREELGVTRKRIMEAKPPPTNPTLEDMVREIVRQELPGGQ